MRAIDISRSQRDRAKLNGWLRTESAETTKKTSQSGKRYFHVNANRKIIMTNSHIYATLPRNNA